MLDHGIDPRRLRRRWTSNAQPTVHGLYGARRMVVQFEIRFLSGRSLPEVDVWFVPHFEIPRGDFVDAVALDQVPGELRDHVVPLGVILRRGDVGAIPKCLDVRTRSKLVRHETELDKRLDAICQKTVVNLVNVGKVVNRPTVFVFVVNADFVVEDRVEAHVLQAGDLLDFAQIAAPGIAQGENGAARTENLLPIMRKGMRWPRGVYRNGLARHLSGYGKRTKQKNN